MNWDLVVFDEYHFGAWRETARELFEGEDDAVAKKEAMLEYAAGLEGVNEDLSVLSEKESEFLPITTRAYLYLSGTPFKALATGEFIEEQIFNWTYTDEQQKTPWTFSNPWTFYLVAEVYASLVDYLDTSGALRVPPFDTSPCEQATLKDISRKRVEWFLDTARRERGFPLKSNTSTQALLTHLNLVHEHKPTNAAIMLFGSNPQKFHRTAETKCMHCRGTEYRRPFVSMQVYGGDHPDDTRHSGWERRQCRMENVEC